MEEKIFKILLNSPDHTIGVMGEGEQRLVQTAVDAYLRGETVCFEEFVHEKQWQYFYEGTKDRKGKISLFCPLPTAWPVDPLMEITVWHRHNFNFAEKFNHSKSSFPTQYHRQADSFDCEFVVPYGSWQHERETAMQTLERLNILDRSVYSRPPQNTDLQEHINCDYLFPIHSQADARTIEGTTNTIDHGQRFDHGSNIFNLYETSKRAHCWVVMDSYCLNDSMSGTVSEKVLYPILYGVPFIYIGNPEQQRTLKRWGIQPNDPIRSTVRGVAEQMQWLQSIFRDPELAQQWQDHQGQVIESNSQALRNLPDLLKKSQ